MIRLMLLLCGGLYLGMLVLGADHGQKRYGLMLADKQPVTVAATVQPDETSKDTIFIPSQTVMQPIAVVATPQDAIVNAPPIAATPDPVVDAALPAPEITGGALYTVVSAQANVRDGPGKTFNVVDTLSQGEQLLLVDDPSAPDGWSKVRIEGDGSEGYVATRLLRAAE